MEWQDIETAPKDEEILLGHWGDQHDEWLWIVQGSFEAEPGRFWSCIHDEDLAISGYHTPTHWMPLPPPPEGDQ